jgi:hypothetical protein
VIENCWSSIWRSGIASKIVGSNPTILHHSFLSLLKYMSKTDSAFYLLMAGGVLKQLSDAYNSVKQGEAVDWIIVSMMILSSLIYAFYGKLTGTEEVPKV